MNICFIMYPWETLDPVNDSTIRIIHEAVSRGHTVGITYPHKLTIRNSVSYGFVKIFRSKAKISKSIPTFYKLAVFKEKMLPMAGFDVIFLRSDPPIDNIMLNFLDSVKKDCFIVNDIDGLRKASNKLYTAAFYDPENKIIPATHVTKNKDYLKRIIRESKKDKMILKPLNGYGGSGVIVIEKTAIQNVNSLLDYYIDGKDGSNYVILQEYVEGAELGDIRVIMLNGEAIGAMRRIPSADDNRANIHAGGTVVKHVLTKQEKEICKEIAPKLVADGLYFAGIDIINGKLIEVNVTSPGGISRINRLNRTKLQTKVLDFVENVIREKTDLQHRKYAYRKKISEL
ncbi:MAG: glutathione synthase [Marinilabiliales bacterium]|nr:MAG: glutathione synthase [Marinilabiliales bacterium]